MIRPATPEDLAALVDLEEAVFTHDRISRRNFRHLLTAANALSLVDKDRQGLCGYATLLFNRRSAVARIYSLAVHPRCRGRGLGTKLIAALEKACRARACTALRLEVHPRNAKARRLYKALGYREFGRYSEYYEDGADAVRMEKTLAPARAARRQA